MVQDNSTLKEACEDFCSRIPEGYSCQICSHTLGVMFSRSNARAFLVVIVIII